MDTWFTLTIIAILLLLSAFFSGSETALTAASKAKLHALEKEGSRRAALVNKIQAHKEKMIGALLLGNNLVNIMASALTTGLLISLFGETGILYATIVMTALILIFSEVMPKTYAIYHADKVALAVAPVMTFVILILSPLTLLISSIVKFLLSVLGAPAAEVKMGIDVDELRGAIELHRGPEEETQTQRAMLRSILELADVEVSEIMIHRRNVEMVDADQDPGKLLDEILSSQYTRFPVWRDTPDNIIGVIHVKALLREIQSRRGGVSDIEIETMMGEPWFIPDTTTLFDQLQAFRRRREHFALVVDEYGSFMGIVTLEDILEEIVGEIDDEHDARVAGVRKQPNGTFLVDGTVTIRDLNREFEWNLPDDYYNTLAGLVIHESQKIPDVGQSFLFFGFKFDIVRRQRNQITLIRITPPVLVRPRLMIEKDSVPA